MNHSVWILVKFQSELKLNQNVFRAKFKQHSVIHRALAIKSKSLNPIIANGKLIMETCKQPDFTFCSLQSVDMTLELENLQMMQETGAASTQTELDKLTADLESVEASLNQIKSKNDMLNHTI